MCGHITLLRRGNIIGAMTIGALFLLSSPFVASASPLSDSVEHLLSAENAFQPAQMAPLLCADYREVSPVGDIDTRAQVLSFYAPSNRSAVSLEKTVLSDTSIDGLPVLTERLHYTLHDPAHNGHETTLIGTWLGKPENGHMTVCQAQFTIFHPSHRSAHEEPKK